MISHLAVSAAAFALGVAVGLWVRRKPAYLWMTREVFVRGKYRLTDNTGADIYLGDNGAKAKEQYNRVELSSGQWVDFYEDDKWRGRRTG